MVVFKLDDTYQRTHEIYSPVGSKKRLITCSGLQSTGADIKKYLTVAQRWSTCQVSFAECLKTYDCQPVAEQAQPLEAATAEHPDLAGRSQERLSATEVPGRQREGLDTCSYSSLVVAKRRRVTND